MTDHASAPPSWSSRTASPSAARGFGAAGERFGEMVFNTGMTGYQETLTDPSYCGQIVAMTAPHIGNTGINDEDDESRRIWVSGYVVREPARITSSWRAARSLDDELRAQDITGIAITGTRALTRHLRDRGAMRAGVSTTEADPAALLERVLASPGMTGADLAREVSTAEPYVVAPPPGTPGPVPGRRGGPGHQGVHPPVPGRAGLRGARAARHRHRGPDPGGQPGRGVLRQRPRRPGRPGLRRRGHARRAGGRACRSSASAWAARSSAGPSA